MDDQVIFVLDVGWSSVRPIIPEQHMSRVRVAADSESEAIILASLMVAGMPASQLRPACEMVSSARVAWVEV